MNPATTPPDAVVIVPVKPPARGKSRLGPLMGGRRRELATAFALDAVTAALATPSVRAVLAVTDDAVLADRLATLGCTVQPDGATGLNEVLVVAAAEASRLWPSCLPVALLADLPALAPDDLAEALTALASDRACFVRDHHGSGTTLYAAPIEQFAPHFGPDSAAAHLDAGAREVVVRRAGLRLDVDDEADLAAAAALGVGPHTRAVIASGHDEGGSPGR